MLALIYKKTKKLFFAFAEKNCQDLATVCVTRSLVRTDNEWLPGVCPVASTAILSQYEAQHLIIHTRNILFYSELFSNCQECVPLPALCYSVNMRLSILLYIYEKDTVLFRTFQ
jgi:hypothetical protein